MPEALKRLQQQAIELWKDMDGSQRARMITVSILVVLGLSIGIFWVTRPNYEYLFNGRMDEKEVSEISKVLTDNRIEHKLVDGGNIKVKARDIEQAQLMLSQEGYPKGGMTFTDALSSIKLSTTESDKKKIFKEYTEQKIARGLKTIDAISSAIVNISIPEREVYLGDEKTDATKASVLVKSNGSLSKQQIAGIENFVAGSVEGLDKKNVEIIDQETGNMLNSGDEGDISTNTTTQMGLQNEKKKQMEEQVANLLPPLFDGVKVAANIVLDFNTESTKEVIYSPVLDDTGVIRSTEEHKEEVQNGSSTGGVPGTDSNTGVGTPSYASSNGGSSYKKTDSVKNYEINQVNKETEKGLGQVDYGKSSITVTLMYGDKKKEAPAQNDIDTYTKMIQNATGIAVGNITIASFKISEVQSEKQEFDIWGLIGKVVPLLLLAVFVVLLAMGVMRNGEIESSLVLSRGGGGSLSSKLLMNVSAMNEDEYLPEIELEEKNEVKKQIDKFVKKKPEAVAQLLRNWLSDEWEN